MAPKAPKSPKDEGESSKDDDKEAYAPRKYQRWLVFLKSEKWNQRWTLCIMGILGYANLYTARIVLSHALEKTTNSQGGKPPVLPWSETEKGLAKSIFYAGYIVSHVPGGLLADRYGGKIVFGVGVLLTGLTGIATPFATQMFGLPGMIAVRIIMGLGEGVTFPAGSCLLSKWIPPQERSLIGGLVVSGNQFGIIMGHIGSGFMLQDFEWPISFYVWGMLCVAYSVVFYFVCYSEPRFHPFISQRELEFLQENVTGVKEKDHSVPWLLIFSSLPVWTCILCQIGHDFGYFVMLTDLPKFLQDVLYLNARENGIMSAIPYMVMWPCSLFFCWLADFVINRGKLSRIMVRKVWTGIGSAGPGVLLVVASYCYKSLPVTMVVLALGMGTMAFYYAGVRINPLDLSPRHAGLITALANGIGASFALLTPNIVGLIADPGTVAQWQLVFWITLGVMVIFGAPFVVFASADRQWWDNHEAVEEHNQKQKAEKERKKAEKQARKAEKNN